MKDSKTIDALVAFAKPKKMESEEEIESGGSDEEIVMDEFLEAVANKDLSGALESFKSLLDVCKSGDK